MFRLVAAMAADVALIVGTCGFVLAVRAGEDMPSFTRQALVQLNREKELRMFLQAAKDRNVKGYDNAE